MRADFDAQDFWEVYARNIEYNVPENFLHKRIMSDLLQWTKETFDTTFTTLDIGSGNGRLFNCFMLANVPTRVTMVDFSEKGRNLAARNIGIMPDKWDGKVLPYEDRQFDLVVLNEVLLHVHPDSVEQVWSEAKRVCNRYVFVTSVVFEEESKFCVSHDYSKLFEDTKLLKIEYYGVRKKTNQYAANYFEME
jgi:SAM-dependent methyltransferase